MVNDRCGGFVPSQAIRLIDKSYYQKTHVFSMRERQLSGNLCCVVFCYLSITTAVSTIMYS